MKLNKIYCGDCLETMKTWPDAFVDCCVTSPPYWGLRDYGVDGQLGLEATPEEFVAKMVEIFAEVWRVLKPEGTLWLNLGDSYCSGGRKTQVVDRLRRGDHDPASGKQGYLNGTAVRPGPVEGLKTKDLCGIPWMVAYENRRDYIGCELNPEYIKLNRADKAKQKYALFEGNSD